MKYGILFIIILALSASIYWLYGTKTISGQVFIVTKGRGNVEMGSLEIRFIEENSLLEYGKKNASELLTNMNDFEIFIKNEEEDQGKEYKDFNYSKKIFSVTYLEKKAQKAILERIGDLKMSLNIRKKFNQTNNDYIDKNENLSAILYAMNLVKNKEIIKVVIESSYPSIVFEMGNPVAKTDSNGRFTAKIPITKKGFLIAHCERQVFDKVEQYYWLEPIDSDTIMLTNDNLWE